MNLLSLFGRRRTGTVARDRLQILLAHERVLSSQPDLVAILQEEILAVIAKHVAIDRDKVMVKLDRGNAVSTLEIDIEMPSQTAAKALAAKKVLEPAKPEPVKSARKD